MKKVEIGDVIFGEGLPKIIVPIAETDERSIYSQAKEYKYHQTDIIEWRADYYEDAANPGELLRILKKLRRTLGRTPLIFTCRTDNEAGEVHLSEAEYITLYQAIIDSGLVEAIDIETERYRDKIQLLIHHAHRKGIAVIGSDVYPEETPSKEEMLQCMQGIQALDADIVKIAALNHDSKDALRIMEAAREMVDSYADRPVIAMGMGAPGVITRIACESIGTCGTYGAVGAGSAAGQFPAERLQSAMKILHAGMKSAL